MVIIIIIIIISDGAILHAVDYTGLRQLVFLNSEIH